MGNIDNLRIGNYVRCYGDHRCARLIGEVVSIGPVNIKVRSYYNPGGLQEPIGQIHKVAKVDVREISNEQSDPRARRLARNEEIRQRNRAKAAENERKPRCLMVTVVMNPNGDERR